MTTLGKVLAVLNLVLSLAVAAFIIMTYVGKTNWHAAWELQSKQTEAARANTDTYKVDVDKLNGDLKAANAAKEAAETKAQQIQTAADARAKADVDKLDAEKKKTAALENNQASLTAQIARLNQELDVSKARIARRDEQLRDMLKQVTDSRDRAVQFEIDLNTVKLQNQRLLQQVETLTKQIQQQGPVGAGTAVTSGAAPKVKPPLEDVSGTIVKTDASGYLTLSIGSDAGLSKGNTLEVYRLKPEPKYLGTIEILAVRPTEAVAKPISRPNGVIQVNDRVASRITTGKR